MVCNVVLLSRNHELFFVFCSSLFTKQVEFEESVTTIAERNNHNQTLEDQIVELRKETSAQKMAIQKSVSYYILRNIVLLLVLLSLKFRGHNIMFLQRHFMK